MGTSSHRTVENGQLPVLYRPGAARQDAPAVVAGARYARLVEPSVSDTTPTAEKPKLSDRDRTERLALLEVADVAGVGDHDTLATIEQLTRAER